MVVKLISTYRTIPDYNGDEPWNLSNPQIYGLPKTTEAFRISLESDKPEPYLGAWYMTPKTSIGLSSHQAFSEGALGQ